MTKAEQRAREVAAVVTEQAKAMGMWTQQAEDELVAALIRMQEIAVGERLALLLPTLSHAPLEVRPCARCGVLLAFYATSTGKRMPISVESGLNHFADCPHAGEFRKGGAA